MPCTLYVLKGNAAAGAGANALLSDRTKELTHKAFFL